MRSPEPAPRTASDGGQTVFAEVVAEAVPSDVVDLPDGAEEEDREKELESADEACTGRTQMNTIPAPPETVRVEIEVPRESLPPSLRLAMEEAGEDSLRLPAEIRIRLR